MGLQNPVPEVSTKPGALHSRFRASSKRGPIHFFHVDGRDAAVGGCCLDKLQIGIRRFVQNQRIFQARASGHSSRSSPKRKVVVGLIEARSADEISCLLRVKSAPSSARAPAL